jgi:hypothetical protein
MGSRRTPGDGTVVRRRDAGLVDEDGGPRMTDSTARVLMLTPDVDALNRVGIDSVVVHRKPGFRCSWFQNSTPIAHVGSIRVGRHDVVVVPEEWVAFIPELPAEIPKVIFHQNAYSTFSWGVEWAALRDVMVRPDVKRVVVVSEDNGAYLRYAYPAIDVRRMRYTIDQSLFRPPDQRTKKRQLAYMPRRRSQESNDVLSLLRTREALGDWAVVAIDKLTEVEVAKNLQESAVFLSFSLREGLPLPPAEAMACGCVVVGFHGFGGRDFGEHAIWVPEGDVVEFARTVESVIATWESDADRFRRLTEQASSHIRETYEARNTEADVRSAFAFSTSGVPAGGDHVLPDSMWQEPSFGQKLLERTRRAARVMLKG